MSNQNQTVLSKAQRKAIRTIATADVVKNIPWIKVHKFPFSMFGARVEEEHLLHRGTTKPLRFVMGEVYETVYFICPICGKEVLPAYTTIDLRAHMQVCIECMTTRTSKCAKCGERTTSVTLATLRNGKMGAVCNECRTNNFSTCYECGKLIYDSNLVSTNDRELCPDCNKKYRSKNHYCGRCGTWVPTEIKIEHPNAAGEYLCPSCFAIELRAKFQLKRPMKKCIGYTSTGGKVFFTTFPAKILFLGAEVEVTNGYTPEEYDRIDPTFAEDLHLFMEVERKSDGSVSRGHELATQAMELGYHQQYFRWKELMALHARHHFDGHDSPKAGYHIHGSLAFFGERATAARNLKLGKLLFMLDRKDWRNQWKKFSRRDNKAVRDAGITDPWGYCQFYDYDWDNLSFARGFELALEDNRNNRNRVLNFHNHHVSPIKLLKTVEWRGLKSHTNHQVILAGLEMMDLLCRIAESKITEAEVRAMTWKMLCKKVPNSSPNLVWYLQSKKLWER